MLRFIASLVIVVALLSSARAAVPLNQAGAEKKPAPPAPADARQKIIAELNADGDNATENLQDRETRAALARQQRILDNIDELLKQKDPAPKAGNSPNPPPPRPMGSSEQKPNPKPDPGEPKPQPNQSKQAKPQSQPQAAKPAPQSSKQGETAPSLEKPAAESKYGKWELPPRLPQGIDALARDRFLDRYEELLRAYYRNIAETNRRERD